MDILLYINFTPKTADDDMHVKVLRGMYTDVILKSIFKKNEWMCREMPRWVCAKARYSNYISGRL